MLIISLMLIVSCGSSDVEAETKAEAVKVETKTAEVETEVGKVKDIEKYLAYMQELEADFWVRVGGFYIAPKTPENSWKMEADENNDLYYWEIDGIKSILSAETEADARKGAADWLDICRKGPAKLQFASKRFLNKDVAITDLVDKNGYATPLAMQLTDDLAMYLSKATVRVENNPQGYNTGIVDGMVVRNTTPGVSGNAKCISVTGEDGKVTDIAGKCGNIIIPVDEIDECPIPVFTIEPPVPEKGPTPVNDAVGEPSVAAPEEVTDVVEDEMPSETAIGITQGEVEENSSEPDNPPTEEEISNHEEAVDQAPLIDKKKENEEESQVGESTPDFWNESPIPDPDAQ